MLASFIIPFHTRRIDNLFQTLRFLERWHGNIIDDCEVLLICQDQCGPIETNFAETRKFDLRMPEMNLPEVTNFGVEKAKSSLLVWLESDRILPKGYFEQVFFEIKSKEMISTEKMHRVSKMVADEDIIAGVYPWYEECRSQTNKMLCRNMFSGNVTFWKKDFLEAGGADPFYVGYGWLDHDLTDSMTKIGVRPIFYTEIELHLWHEPMTYGSKDQKKLFVNNGIHYCKKWKKRYPPEIIKELQSQTKVLI